MVNIEEFIKRLELLLDYYNLNASSFADQIGVQRSSISHLLSGRNKPSLDFILKILEVFPEVDLYWILNGKGVFPKSEKKLEEKNISIQEKQTPIQPSVNKPNQQENLFSENETVSIENKNIVTPTTQQGPLHHENNNEVEKIVYFYKNGTFKIYTP